MSKSIQWTPEVIKAGIDRFLKEAGHLPTARDFDQSSYLPSARQIQRAYGGLPALRTLLGITQIDYTKGDLRRTRALQGYTDGLSAEEKLELILVKKFGEVFVHTQKRYGLHIKNRYDFFVYCQDECFAVDVFFTTRAEYISTNIRHKIQKYKELGNFKVYFVVYGNYSSKDISEALKKLPTLQWMSHIIVLNTQEFISLIEQKVSLPAPKGFVSSIS